MKRLLFLFFFIGTVAGAQTRVNNQLFMGTVDSISSRILGEKRTIWISVPAGALNDRFAARKYPVVYLLDGNSHFATVSAMLKQLAAQNGNMILPEMIVVGILNTDRTRDFTPTKSSYWIYGPPSPLENTGGGERFVEFLEKELIPHIDSIYPTAPYRVLIGHSLGGLAVTNVLVNHTKLFNAYIIIDPSMWYDNRKFLMEAKASLQEKKYDGISLYLGIANSMQPDMDTLAVRKDTSVESFHTRSILLLKDYIQQNHHNGLRFAYSYHDDDTHMSVPLIAEYEGLRFIFNYYSLAPGIEARFFDPHVAINPAPIFIAHFQEVSKQIGYQFLPPENLINIFANSFLDYNLPKKAFSLYSLNLLNYPQSFDTIVSMGDYCNSQNDKMEATAFYQKALNIKEDKETRGKLNKLKKQE
jgi:predicted alpha/beta superfamily hydrolase